MTTDRAQLTHAYGSAADTPGPFTRLDGGARNEALLMAGLVIGASGADERKLYEDQIAELLSVARDFLAGIPADAPGDFVYLQGLLAADPAELPDTGARLHTLALQGGQDELAVSLTRLFGRARCGECETVFGVAEALVD
ncbi:hypothetical protein [Streptomyces acidiscabies]|uniref:Uncharacterized protein n=1 Tax=Streptomyces acidiscabies TaxID=42234 RepID=A0A0L0KEK1_9ACTN|nr:hypothetical protein [Streptomyces acidiscabies]KND36049.1 hypothetical protein IQ63_13615 [Streptomyces acidiscabies]